MANPQPTDAHLRVAHSINEQLMVSNFTEQQRRILDLVLRLSWGCGKKTAIIPYQSDFEVVGVGRTHIKSHLDWLAEAKVIIRENNEYSFNKDFDQWRCSRALQYTPERMAELVKRNLNGSYGKRNSKKEGVTENVTGVLLNTEQLGYGKRNSARHELASPKESIKKVLNKDIYILPEWLDKDTWNAYLEMRKNGKKPPTDYALKLIIAKLEKLKATGDDPNEILNQSIISGWSGVYPLKQEKDSGKYKGNFGPEKVYTHLPLPKSITDPDDEEFERSLRDD